MSVASEYTPVQTACNGSLTAFSFSFPIFDTSDLKVYLKTVATGAKTLLTETTHYTVSATNNDYTNGGTVTTVATYSSDYEIIIERDIPYTQPTDLEEAGRIPSNTLDDTHDRALMQIQQVNNKVQRALVMPVSDDSALDMELPNEIDRASKFLAFDADGEPIASSGTPTSDVVVSAYMETVLDDANAAAARVTLAAVGETGNTSIAGVITFDGAPVLAGTAWPSFSVHRNGTEQSNITGTDQVEYNTEVFDTNSDYDTSAFRFTPTVAGKYLLCAVVRWKDVVAGEILQLTVNKGATPYKQVTTKAQGTSDETLMVVVVVDANAAGDYFEVFAANTSRDTSDIKGETTNTYWTGCRVG